MSLGMYDGLFSSGLVTGIIVVAANFWDLLKITDAVYW